MAKTATEQKYAKLNKTTDPSQNAQLVYPQDLLNESSTQGHYVLFNINQLTGSSFTSKATQNVENVQANPYGDTPVFQSKGSTSIRSKVKMSAAYTRTIESMVLPMPEQVATTYGVQWQNAELGTAAAALNAIQNYDQITLEDVTNRLGESAKNTITGMIQGLTGFNAKDAAEMYTGTIANPFVETLFKGVNNRELPMTFKFSPRNEDETKIVREIIRRFKFHMYPEFKYKSEGSSYFLYPSTFDITYMIRGEHNKWLHRMSTCALTTMTVNDTAVGEYAVLQNGSPVQITIDLVFTEMEQLSKNHFTDPDNSF
jgi:hypothetical protein